jgi:hypothetical protein
MSDTLTLTARLNDGTLIAGRAAFFEPPPPLPLLRRLAARQAYAGQLSLTQGLEQAEQQLREAIELMVDAFLLDRRRNVDLYSRAHNLGALLAERIGCSWQVNDDLAAFENTCGILALHSRIGLSPGGRTWGRCSICAAKDFECDHVPGETYEGRACFRTIYEWDAEEMSLTTRPRDPRCFRTWSPIPRSHVPVVALSCNHCTACAGRAGPSDDDLEPGSWNDDPDVLVATTVAVSRVAAGLTGPTYRLT